MTVDIQINLTTKGAQDLLKRMVDVRKEVSTLATATRAVQELPLGTQQQLKRMDQAIAKTSALRERITAVRKELQTSGTPRLLELAEREAKESLVDVERLNASVKELRDGLENPVSNRLATATQAVANPRIARPAASGGTASLNDRTFGQLAGAATALNIPGGSSLRIVADIADVTENLPKLAEEIKLLGVAGVASTAAIGGYAAAFYLLNKSIKSDAEAVKEAGKAELERLEAIKQTRTELRGLSFDEVSQKIADLEEDVANATATRAKREQELSEALGISTGGALKEFLAASVSLQNIDLSDPAAAAERYADSLKQLVDVTGLSEGEISAAKAEIDGYNESIADQTAEIARLRSEVLAFTQGRDAASGFLTELEQAGKNTLQTQHDIRNLSSEDVKQQIRDAEDSLQIARDSRAAIANEIIALQSQWATATGDEAKRLEGEITGLITASQTYDAAIQAENTELQRLTDNVLKAVITREREARAVERISDLHQHASDQADRAADALKKFTDAQQTLANFDGQLATEELNKRREASINAVYDAQLKAIDSDIERAKASEKAQQIQQKQVELQVSANEKVRDTNSKFMQQELERLSEFRKAEARINDDFARDQRRRLEDLNDELSEADLENDVVAFIQAQKEGTKDLSRASEDANVDAARRIEDFNSETQRNHADHARAIFDIDRTLQEQQLQLRATAGGQELTLLDQLQAKRAEIIANREASLEQFRQQLEVEQTNRRRQAIIAQMNAAQEDYKRLNEMALTSGRVIGSNFMNSIISGASSQMQQAFNAVSSAVSRIRIPSFAGGGDVHSPTLAMVGDTGAGWSEKMIPYRTNRGLTMQDVAPHMGGSLPPVNVNFYGSMGGNVDEIEARVVSGVTKALRQVRSTGS